MADIEKDKIENDDSADIENDKEGNDDNGDDVSDNGNGDEVSEDEDGFDDVTPDEEIDAESDVDDSADLEDSDGDQEEPEEVAAKSSLLYKALSNSSEAHSDEYRIVETKVDPMDTEWESLMGDFLKQKVSDTVEARREVRTLGIGSESIDISSFGFSDVIKFIDDENRFVAKNFISKLPDHAATSFKNCFNLSDQNSTNIDILIKLFKDKLSANNNDLSTFKWGAYSRQFMCGNHPLDNMPDLLAAVNQQLILHQHIGNEGFEHLLGCTNSVLKFLKEAREDALWPKAFKQLTDDLALTDKKLQLFQEQLLRRTDPTTFPPIAPEVLKRRKFDATGKALVSIMDSIYYCRHSPKNPITHLHELVYYGVSLEQDTEAEKNQSSGIDAISNKQMLSMLLMAKHTLLVIKNYESRLVKLIDVLTNIKIQYNKIRSNSDYHLSVRKQEELYFIGIYLMEIVTNPHIANVWQAMRLVHTAMYISNQLLPQSSAVYHNFQGFEMKQTKILMNALEHLVDTPVTNGAIFNPSTPIGETSNDPVNALSGVDVHPDDQRAIDENVELAEQSTQLGNSVSALEGLQNTCKQLIKYGTPKEQRAAIVNINSNHNAICRGLGLRAPYTVAVESNGGELIALEGLFDAIGDTIKNVVQSVKNMWTNWRAKREESKLRDKAAAGNIFARMELITRKKHLLVEARGEDYTNKAVISNIGLYGKINTVDKALEAVNELHRDYNQYYVQTEQFGKNFSRMIKSSRHEEVRASIVGDIESYRRMVYPEKKNPHAVNTHLGRDQTVWYTRPVPGNSVLAIVMPDEIFNDKFSGDKIDEIRVTDLSSGIRRDSLSVIKTATIEDYEQVRIAMDRWVELARATYEGWDNVMTTVEDAEEIAEYVYSNIQGRQQDATDAANMTYRYIARFLPQVIIGLNIRASMSNTAFAGALTWIEESILKAEEIIKSRPAVGV